MGTDMTGAKRKRPRDYLRRCKTIVKGQLGRGGEEGATGAPNGLEREFDEVKRELRRVVVHRESASLLLMGARGSGKRLTLARAIASLEAEEDSGDKRSVVITLNGLFHTDEALALRYIASVLAESPAGPSRDLERGSYATNLAFILECLECHALQGVPVLFVLCEMQAFTEVGQQTLLYTLLDLGQNKGVNIGVVCLSCRLDVTQQLEKRVLSRLGTSRIIFKHHPHERLCASLADLLQVGEGLSKDKDEEKFRLDWNKSVLEVLSNDNERVCSSFMRWSSLGRSFKWFSTLLLTTVCRISPDEPRLTYQGILAAAEYLDPNLDLQMLQSLPGPELLVTVAMSRLERRSADPDPYCFDALQRECEAFHRLYPDMGAAHYYPRAVLYHAFTTLWRTGIVEKKGRTARKPGVPGQYDLVSMAINPQVVVTALKQKAVACPTVIEQWCIHCVPRS
jgi:hypothetical protein